MRNNCGNPYLKVRLAACVATRNLIQTLGIEAFLQNKNYIQILLPPLCFNRYYLAEGIKKYSQETWFIMFNDGTGKLYVETNIDHICGYYLNEIKSDNAVICETTCFCLSELALKIDKSLLNPYIETILKSLIQCHNGQLWTVRDGKLSPF